MSSVMDLSSAGTRWLSTTGETVNADQQGASAGVNTIIAELPKVLRNSYVISSKGCECRPDHLHFTPAGYRELGKRYAEKMPELA